MDLNVVTITGRLADDPKPYATGNGGDVTMLRVAVGRPKRPGQQRSEADFVDVAAWDEQAKLAAKYLAKGLRVGVTGRLQQRTWETPEGKRSRLQVVAGQLHFIDFKEQAEQSPHQANGRAHTAAAAQAAAPSTDAEVAESRADAPQPVIQVVVQADGGARGNPGPAGFGVVVMTPAGEVLAELAEPIGRATNNVAEYQAVIAGLERARSLGARRVEVQSDSQLVIRQLTGAWQVKTAALEPLWAKARGIAEGFEQVIFTQVPREETLRADALANQAMSRQGQVTDPAKATAQQPPVATAAAAEASRG
jgi:single stranded DNA-binding protein